MSGIDNNTILYLRGDSFNDLSLNPKTITNNGVTIVDGGKFGKCMEFNNHTYTKATISLNYTFNSDFTISAYCKLLKSGTSSCYLIGSTAANNEIYFAVNRDMYLDVAFHNIGNQIIVSTEKIPLNKIVHIAFVRKSGTLKCYIDGRCVGAVSYSGSPNITTMYLHGGVNSVWQMSNLELSSVARWEGNFTPPTRSYNSININITNQIRDKIDFNITKLGQETINKTEILINNEIVQTYNEIGDLTYIVDEGIMRYGNNNINIRVTFDDIYTEEVQTTYLKEVELEEFEPVVDLPSTANIQDIVNRISLINSINKTISNNLKNLLISKGFEVGDTPRLSNMVKLVNELSNNNTTEITEYINRITELENKIDVCITNLNQILTSKGVVLSESDKLDIDILINKVNELEKLNKIYIYNRGVTTYTFSNHAQNGNTGSLTVTNKSDHIYIKTASVLSTNCGVVTQIDLTNYRYIKATMEKISNIHSPILAILSSIPMNGAGTNIVDISYGSSDASNKEQTMIIDVSNLSGIYYVLCGGQNGSYTTAEYKLYELWLEK